MATNQTQDLITSDSLDDSIVTQIERGCTCFGMFTNTCLLPIIIFRSPQDIGVYKFLMMYIAVFELFFGWLELMTVPEMFTEGSAFIVTIDPDKAVLPDGFLQISILIYCGSFATSLAIFGVQFAYRYEVLRGNTPRTSYSFFNFVFWGGIPLIVALLWTLSCWVFLGRNEYVDMVMRQDSFPSNLGNKTIGFVGIYFYPRLLDGSTVINWDSFIGMALCTCILFGSETLMLYFAFKSYLITKTLMTSTCSTSFRRLQWQLFYALISQTIIPILFMQIPLSILYVTLFLNISIPLIGKLQAFTISLYLTTDALPTMLIIRPYRETILVGRSSRIFIVSNSPQDVLGNLGVYVGTQVKTGATLALPGPTGSLTPLIPSEDNSTLLIVQNGSKNCTGYLYITEDTTTNVFPLSNNRQEYNFQPGTNLYFSLDYKNDSIDYPCAQNVCIGDNVSFRGYVGLPEENGRLFFDSGNLPTTINFNFLWKFSISKPMEMT
ncbi:hypothetical protein B9Z55_027753 [Caenorhabditis nigoni]|uniref:Uncharacterized protein n=1 Tax=Caenorhabditis nigoni TaxID=1611254 RepID=A0A2G5SE66_9PELO|nr:hypothetical protein B9Z55_027753 [Caenorhabditis nigoni]